MKGYWVRHRLIATLIVSVAVAAITALLFVFPYISQLANDYNTQSVYKNTDIDFIAPEPSFDQVKDLQGMNGIGTIFPYYMTKTQVNVNGQSRETIVLLSDDISNIDITMYNSYRLIEKASSTCENPILVDWQFCHDTDAKVGDKISFTIAGQQKEFTISAIYETNSVYDGGAILAEISEEQRNEIVEKSKNNGYSGMYIAASDYSSCRNFLTSDYRPLGRLKQREQFESEEQYQLHYDAIMSTGFANEITDFHVRASEKDKDSDSLMIWIAIGFSFLILLVFNIVMAKRGCEKVYFTKHCIPKGMPVGSYYVTAFVGECIIAVVTYAGALLYKVMSADFFIPKSSFDYKLALVPAAFILVEVVCLIINVSMIASITKKFKKSKKENDHSSEKE